MVEVVYQDDLTVLCCGDAADGRTDGVDLVITNPYGPIPRSLHKTPMLIIHFRLMKPVCEEYVGGELFGLSDWYTDHDNGEVCIWYANTNKREVKVDNLLPAEYEGIRGWFPKELTDELLGVYPARCVWDGFMGRGTVGRSCREKGIKFIGIDRNPDRVDMARRFILGHR